MVMLLVHEMSIRSHHCDLALLRSSCFVLSQVHGEIRFADHVSVMVVHPIHKTNAAVMSSIRTFTERSGVPVVWMADDPDTTPIALVAFDPRHVGATRGGKKRKSVGWTKTFPVKPDGMPHADVSNYCFRWCTVLPALGGTC